MLTALLSPSRPMANEQEPYRGQISGTVAIGEMARDRPDKHEGRSEGDHHDPRQKGIQTIRPLNKEDQDEENRASGKAIEGARGSSSSLTLIEQLGRSFRGLEVNRIPHNGYPFATLTKSFNLRYELHRIMPNSLS